MSKVIKQTVEWEIIENDEELHNYVTHVITLFAVSLAVLALVRLIFSGATQLEATTTTFIVMLVGIPHFFNKRKYKYYAVPTTTLETVKMHDIEDIMGEDNDDRN